MVTNLLLFFSSLLPRPRNRLAEESGKTRVIRAGYDRFRLYGVNIAAHVSASTRSTSYYAKCTMRTITGKMVVAKHISFPFFFSYLRLITFFFFSLFFFSISPILTALCTMFDDHENAFSTILEQIIRLFATSSQSRLFVFFHIIYFFLLFRTRIYPQSTIRKYCFHFRARPLYNHSKSQIALPTLLLFVDNRFSDDDCDDTDNFASKYLRIICSTTRSTRHIIIRSVDRNPPQNQEKKKTIFSVLAKIRFT